MTFIFLSFLLKHDVKKKKLQDLNDELILEVEKLKKELKVAPYKSDDALFDSKKKQKIDSSWNECTMERKSHKKRHSLVTHFEERNQSETCDILHNLGSSKDTSIHVSSTGPAKGQSLRFQYLFTIISFKMFNKRSHR